MMSAALISGFALGSMYALLALGFHITYAVSKTVNFAQGSAMMVGAVLGYSLAVTFGLPWWLAIFLTLFLCAIYGLMIERFLVRPFSSVGSDAWLMATVAGGIFVDNVVLFTFGKEPRQFTMELTNMTVQLLGSGVHVLQLIIPCVGIAIAVGLSIVKTKTRLGKALQASVQHPSSAQLMGIPVARMIAFAFALSTVFAGIAGLLIAPLFSIHSDMGTLFGIKAFAVAILGGIGNASGVFFAGLLFGVVEAVITLYVGSAFTQIITFSVVIAALAMCPNGLFGKASFIKV